MDADNVVKMEVKVFAGITTKYAIKNTGKLLSLRKVFCENRHRVMVSKFR